MKREPSNETAGCRQGDAPDWEAWLDAHGARLLLYARQQTRTEADAEDLLQTALVQLVRTVEGGKFRMSSAQWPAYVISCIRRDACDLYRADRRRRASAAEAAEVAPKVHEDTPWLTSAADAAHDRLCLETALRAMRRDYAEVVVLRVWQELSFREIAEILGEPMPTIASRYRAAMQMLRQQLTPDFLDFS